MPEWGQHPRPGSGSRGTSLHLGAERYMDEAAQRDLVLETVSLIQEIQNAEGQLSALHADPDQQRVAAQIAEINAHLNELYRQRSRLGPLAESILQTQISAVLADQGFTVLGQPLHPLLFHSTPLPWALIASPRDHIAQADNISLRTELTLEEHIALEDEGTRGR